jgi:hypothetical protein
MKRHFYMRNFKLYSDRLAPVFVVARNLGLATLFFAIFFNIACFLLANAPEDTRKRLRHACRYPVEKVEAHIQSKNEELVKGVRDYDVLFVGSSHCLGTFDPRFFQSNGMKIFNYGTRAQTPMNTYYCLQMLSKTINFKKVVIEAFPLMFQEDGSEASLYLYWTANDLDLNAFKMMVASRDRRATVCYLLWKYAFHRPGVMDFERNETYISGGCIERDMKYIGDTTHVPPNTPPLRRQFDYLDCSIKAMLDKHIEVSVVIVPLPEKYLKADTQYQTIVERISQVCARRGVPYVNFNEIVSYPREDFFDWNHLNQNGVNKFLPVFLSEMQKRELL